MLLMSKNFTSLYQPTWEEVNSLLDKKLITAKEHSEAGLFILNYTNEVQYNYLWNPALEACRGLIIDKDCNVVERPFTKFFNHDEPRGQRPLDEDYEVFEKMDGSLGILYFCGNNPYITTKGSFFSDQAKVGTDIYQRKYKWVNINRDWTYLFEIISKESHIVLDYDYEDLILIGIIDKKTGKTVTDPWSHPFRTPKNWGINVPIEKIFAEEQKNREGVVLRTLDTDFRCKIKFERYKNLHKLFFGLCTKKAVLDIMIEYGSIKNFLIKNASCLEIPDESFGFIDDIESEINFEVNTILVEAQNFYLTVNIKTERKAIAESFSKFKYPFLLWGIYELNKRNVRQMCLNIIKKELAKTNGT